MMSENLPEGIDLNGCYKLGVDLDTMVTPDWAEFCRHCEVKAIPVYRRGVMGA